MWLCEWLSFSLPNCTSWSIKRYYMFLQTSPLISSGRSGSSPTTVAAAPAADHPAHWGSCYPSGCVNFAVCPQLPPPMMENHPSAQFEDGSQFHFFFYFSWLTVALQC